VSFLSYSGRGHTERQPGAPALEIKGLLVRYPGHRRAALKDVNLLVPNGSRVALVGSNGAGKSTVLKAVAGLLVAGAGTIRIFGNPVGACHHRVSYLPQRGEIDWQFPISVEKLVMAGRYPHLGWFRRPGPEDRRAVQEAMAELGIESLAGRQISELSGGQQQRTLLARCLAQGADLLLLDEPLNAVDSATIHVISEVLKNLQSRGRTVVAATHDLGRLETDYDGALYLAEGQEVPAPPGSYCGLQVGSVGCQDHRRHV